MEALDMLSNNLANATTGGYKLDREFYSLFSSDEDLGINDEGTPAKLPVIQSQWTDFSQGILTPTGGPLDVALAGFGFFKVKGPSGPLYTRNGSFQISSAGVLTTQEGYPVLGVDGQPIMTQSESPIQISPDGTITQDDMPLGQLAVMDFKDRSVLGKQSGSYFTNLNPKVEPQAATEVTVEQGKIENSNVATAESAVRLVGLMRQFEMLQKAITVTSDMNKQALQEVAKVGP